MKFAHVRNIDNAVAPLDMAQLGYTYVGNGQYRKAVTAPPSSRSAAAGKDIEAIRETSAGSSDDKRDLFRLQFDKYVTNLEKTGLIDGHAPTKEDIVLREIYKAVFRLSAGGQLPPAMRWGNGPKDIDTDLVSEGWNYWKTSLEPKLDQAQVAKGKFGAYLGKCFSGKFLRDSAWKQYSDSGESNSYKPAARKPAFAIRGLFDPSGHEYFPGVLSTDHEDAEAKQPTEAGPSHSKLVATDEYESATETIDALMTSAAITEAAAELYARYYGIAGRHKHTLADLAAVCHLPESTIWDRIQGITAALHKEARINRSRY